MASFAIIPAAGRSRRMGEPKLLLPWGGTNVLEHVLGIWGQSRATRILLVVHPEDHQLAQIGRDRGAEVVVAPVPPPDMKASVALGLEAVANLFSPQPADAWLVAPADIPLLSPQTIDRLLAEHNPQQPAILVPIQACAGGGLKRSHPVLFPWPLAAEAARLPADAGLDALQRLHPCREIPIDGEAAADFDTPQEYRVQYGRHHR